MSFQDDTILWWNVVHLFSSFSEAQMDSLSSGLGSATMALGVALIKQPQAHSGFTWPLVCCSDRERMLPNERLFTLSSSRHQGKWYNWSENLNPVWKLCWNIYRLYLDYLIIYLFCACLWVTPAIPPSSCGFFVRGDLSTETNVHTSVGICVTNVYVFMHLDQLFYKRAQNSSSSLSVSVCPTTVYFCHVFLTLIFLQTSVWLDWWSKNSLIVL